MMLLPVSSAAKQATFCATHVPFFTGTSNKGILAISRRHELLIQ